MFVGISTRRKTVLRWATPLLFVALWLAYVLGALLHRAELDWGVLSGGLDSLAAWRRAFVDGSVLRLFSALFPGARLGVVLPLGIFLQFVRVPASLLIGLWALLQVVFAYSGPAFGAVAWPAHIAGFLFGVVFALLTRAAIARRLRHSRGY